MSFFGPTQRKWALYCHVFSISLWLGAAVAMLTIALLRPARPQTAAALAAYCLSVKLIDDHVIIASSGASLLSGLLLSWKTKWGFFVWYWVAFKLVATVLMVAFGATCLGPWINETARIAETRGLDALSAPEFHRPAGLSLFWGSLQVLLLIGIVGISVFKPWGRIGDSEKRR